jgi:hypothetical protein
MQPPQKRPIFQLQRPVRHLLIPASQPVLVDESIGERHDLSIHSVLEPQIHDSLRMSLRESSEERDVETAFPCFGILDLETGLVKANHMKLYKVRHTRGGNWKWSPTRTNVSANLSGPKHVGRVIWEASSTIQ